MIPPFKQTGVENAENSVVLAARRRSRCISSLPVQLGLSVGQGRL
jgi:hypothetical protein